MTQPWTRRVMPLVLLLVIGGMIIHRERQRQQVPLPPSFPAPALMTPAVTRMPLDLPDAPFVVTGQLYQHGLVAWEPDGQALWAVTAGAGKPSGIRLVRTSAAAAEPLHTSPQLPAGARYSQPSIAVTTDAATGAPLLWLAVLASEQERLGIRLFRGTDAAALEEIALPKNFCPGEARMPHLESRNGIVVLGAHWVAGEGAQGFSVLWNPGTSQPPYQHIPQRAGWRAMQPPHLVLNPDGTRLLALIRAEFPPRGQGPDAVEAAAYSTLLLPSTPVPEVIEVTPRRNGTFIERPAGVWPQEERMAVVVGTWGPVQPGELRGYRFDIRTSADGQSWTSVTPPLPAVLPVVTGQPHLVAHGNLLGLVYSYGALREQVPEAGRVMQVVSSDGGQSWSAPIPLLDSAALTSVADVRQWGAQCALLGAEDAEDYEAGSQRLRLRGDRTGWLVSWMLE